MLLSYFFADTKCVYRSIGTGQALQIPKASITKRKFAEVYSYKLLSKNSNNFIFNSIHSYDTYQHSCFAQKPFSPKPVGQMVFVHKMTR